MSIPRASARSSPVSRTSRPASSPSSATSSGSTEGAARGARADDARQRVGVVRPERQHDARRRFELVVFPLRVERVPQQEVRARGLRIDPDRVPTGRLRGGGAPLREERRRELDVRTYGPRLETKRGAIRRFRAGVVAQLFEQLAEVAMRAHVVRTLPDRFVERGPRLVEAPLPVEGDAETAL